jgi:NAD+ synthase (glutamine-hydrolysing)
MKRKEMSDFFNLYRHGFIRAAVCIPELKVADTLFNAEMTIRLAREAAAKHAVLALFPELGLSAYSNEDLFHQDALLKGVLKAIDNVARETSSLNMIIVVGAPLQVDSRLFNCGIVLHRGRITGVSVKSYLPNYREFYEGRQFSPAEEALSQTISLCSQEGIPFGADLIFDVANIRHFRFFVEMCEDVWVPIPPSCFAAMAGATVIGNLSASNVTIGKSEYRQSLTANQSARCLAAYLYAAAGPGESTTDLAWDGHDLRKRESPCRVGAIRGTPPDHPCRSRPRPSCPGPDAPDQFRPERTDAPGRPPEIPEGCSGDRSGGGASPSRS